MIRLHIKAAEIAYRYNWIKEAMSISNGIVPEGFGKEIGKAISLFINPPPLLGLLMNCKQYQEERELDKLRAKELGKLRMMIAKLRRNND